MHGGTLSIVPAVGTSVTKPQSAAGKRSEPVASDPCATGTAPHATAAAAPPLDPPTDCVRSHGLRVDGKPGGSVVTPFASGGHADFPMIENPERSNRSASAVVWVDRCPALRNAARPAQCGVPAISWPASLSSTGTPPGGRSYNADTRNPSSGFMASLGGCPRRATPPVQPPQKPPCPADLMRSPRPRRNTASRSADRPECRLTDAVLVQLACPLDAAPLDLCNQPTTRTI